MRQVAPSLRPLAAQGPVLCAASWPGVAASIDLAARGYVEEEFLLDGTANVYEYAGSDVVVAEREVPYVTRVLVRRPIDAQAFSGVVHLEPLHPGSGYDRVHTFAETSRYLLASGHAWIGVTCKPDALETLRRFNPDRYGRLQLTDRGQIWDLFGDLGVALHSEAALTVLGGRRAEMVYASGWSMTGSILRTFIADRFHDRIAEAGGCNPFDGYVVGISDGQFKYGYTPLNERSGPNIDTVAKQAARSTIPFGDPRRIMTPPPGVPVIELMSESEALSNFGGGRDDSDSADDRYRCYQVPGRGHSSVNSKSFGELSSVPAATIGVRAVPHPGVTDIDTTPLNSFPTELISQAVFENLDQWVRAATPPPRCARIEIGPDVPRRARVDNTGNALGGLRHPFVDVPVATYASVGGADPLAFGPVTPWHGTYLTRQELDDRYGDADGYLEAFQQRSKELVADRLMLPADADLALAWATERAGLLW